ncbi:hypothetical protein DH2020_035859 [Rehmannia glutinosa]|uniref:CASP-like protein n=1 Tax=Rehmannia glutinosa TaxID=99300 RepID=A0ABR0V5D7_REHGL
MESQYKNSSNGGIESGVAVANKNKMRGWDVVLRFLALALSLTAAVVLGVNKETTTVAVTLVPTLPPVNIPVTAKWHDLSAFVVGAAVAIGLMGYEGNSHVQWKKVCNVFDRFCDQAAAALGLSGGASLAFFMLVVLATLNLHKKH